MQISLPLNKMTSQEKTSTMDILWRGLSQGSEAYESPPWHRDVLECREAGGGEFIDWDEAKGKIRDCGC